MDRLLAVKLHRRLGPFVLDIDFATGPGITVLYGHSGSGKSQTLKSIAGLARPDAGRIVFGDQVLFDASSRIDLPPHHRSVGLVTQGNTLLPHLDVRGNIEFGIHDLPRPRRAARAAELLALLGMEGFERRKPRSLSGGQQQRVALARALARDALILLLDEPFSALDDALRNSMRRELLRLRSELGLTILFVTHDLREAHFLADRIAVFDAGRILQVGPREEVFRRPASRRVAELTGVANIWDGVVTQVSPDAITVDVEGASLRAAAGDRAFAPGERVHAMVRAERVNLRRDMQAASGPRNLVPATIVAEFAYGSTHVLHLQPEGAGPRMEVEIAARPYEVLDIDSRKLFNIEIDPADVQLVPVDDGRATASQT
jgi:ABC-type Fe3+/spermidine/putrescine transport system ATPase subunit